VQSSAVVFSKIYLCVLTVTRRTASISKSFVLLLLYLLNVCVILRVHLLISASFVYVQWTESADGKSFTVVPGKAATCPSDKVSTPLA